MQLPALLSSSLTKNPLQGRLLYISFDDPRKYSIGLRITVSISLTNDGCGITESQKCDPSTIFVILPVSEPSSVADVEKLGYYPSYLEMSPHQRWVYLRWLYDISQPIDVGYVFVYYYGLERHLVLGEFDGAFEEILRLRQHHNHPSFQSYSSVALLHGCLHRKRFDKFAALESLHIVDHFSNTQMLEDTDVQRPDIFAARLLVGDALYVTFDQFVFDVIIAGNDNRHVCKVLVQDSYD